MNTKKSLFLALAIIFVAVNCGDYKPDAFGPYREIVVFSDQSLQKDIEGVLSQTFERTRVTPQDEKEFYLNWIDSLQIETYKKYRNIIFIATLNSTDNISSWVIRNLPKDAKEKIKADKNYIFTKKNLWAEKQTVLFFVAPKPGVLASEIAFNTDKLFSLIDSTTNERLKDWVYSSSFSGEKEKYSLEKKILKNSNYGIRVPSDYWAEEYHPEKNFLWIRRLDPDSWVFVFHKDTNSVDSLELNWWLKKRNWVGQKWYEGDSVREKGLKVERTNFCGHDALKMTGLWENSRKIQGGPLISYLFYDESEQRLYILDGALYAPGTKKTSYLRHLQVIMQTFNTDTVQFKKQHPKFELE